MMKRTARALALVFSALPILLVGCGGGGEQNGTGGSGGGAGGTLGYDGGGGAGGAKVDVGAAEATPPAVDTAPVSVDVALPIDTTPPVDARVPDAPITVDSPVQIDTARLEASSALDTHAVDAVVAIDSPAVCTMTKVFTGGNVTANLTLPAACSPYTIADTIRVEGNATLTIEAGAVLRFQPDVQIWIGYGSAGKITAVAIGR